MAPKRPDKDTDRVGWNASWERELTSIYSRNTSLPPATRGLPPAQLRLSTTPVFRAGVLVYTKEICNLQRDLSSQASVRFATDDFEQKWKGLPLEKREEYALEGIWRTALIKDMEGRRIWCPEITLENLASRDGGGYLKLLAQLMPSELNNRPSEPVMVPNSRVEELLKGSPSEAAHMVRLGRCYFLTLSVWYIFLAFVRAQCGWPEIV